MAHLIIRVRQFHRHPAHEINNRPTVKAFQSQDCRRIEDNTAVRRILEITGKLEFPEARHVGSFVPDTALLLHQIDLAD